MAPPKCVVLLVGRWEAGVPEDTGDRERRLVVTEVLARIAATPPTCGMRAGHSWPSSIGAKAGRSRSAVAGRDDVGLDGVLGGTMAAVTADTQDDRPFLLHRVAAGNVGPLAVVEGRQTTELARGGPGPSTDRLVLRRTTAPPENQATAIGRISRITVSLIREYWVLFVPRFQKTSRPGASRPVAPAAAVTGPAHAIRPPQPLDRSPAAHPLGIVSRHPTVLRTASGERHRKNPHRSSEPIRSLPCRLGHMCHVSQDYLSGIFAYNVTSPGRLELERPARGGFDR
ncbi:MAG: hypothetical protein QG608_3856 [Actinomycetota bacterium]|nr:hypothetical protein [Actinomycetota bacterium]